MAERKGYRLVLCEENGVNAFFLRNDLAPTIPSVRLEDAYRQMRRRVGSDEDEPHVEDVFSLAEAHSPRWSRYDAFQPINPRLAMRSRVKDFINWLRRFAPRKQGELWRMLKKLCRTQDALKAAVADLQRDRQKDIVERVDVLTKKIDVLKRFSNRPCTTWGGRGTSARTDAGGPMRAYSMDLRERALLDSDAGMKAADVAAKYRVSGSWVRLLKQRRRETGEVAPRVQRHGRRCMLEPHLHTLAALIAAQPDRTLAELKDALATPASVPTVWRAVRALGLTVKNNGPPVRTRSA